MTNKAEMSHYLLAEHLAGIPLSTPGQAAHLPCWEETRVFQGEEESGGTISPNAQHLIFTAVPPCASCEQDLVSLAATGLLFSLIIIRHTFQGH